MKPLDYAKATGVGLLLLVLNVLLSIPVILFYSLVIDPGHPPEYYEKAALKIAPWCSHITGTALFFIAGYFLTKRKPERNGLMFAAVFTACYALIDVATVGFAGMRSIEEWLSISAKLAAALGGAFLAQRGRGRTLQAIRSAI
jgi:hypothetical protein